MFRHERKFVTRSQDVRQVEMLARMHPATFRETYPPRYVNSLYLDSMFFGSYEDNVAGHSDRVKYRIRWYGDLGGEIEEAFLEAKIKRSDVGTKQRFPLPRFTFDPRLSAAGVRRLLRGAEIAQPVRERCLTRDVVVLVRYRRKYFLSRDRRYRLTIDWNIEAHGRSPGGRGFSRRRVSPATVLELKYDPENSDGADRISAAIPLRLVKSSKYVQAVATVYGSRGVL